MPQEERNIYRGNAHERVNKETRQSVTPELFQADGSSPEARRFAEEWEESQRAGDLVALSGCGDARFTYNPAGGIVGIRSIAATSSVMIEGVNLAVFSAHHDGATVKDRVRPGGCGGREEKAKMRGNGITEIEEEGAARFVDRRVAHEDPIIGAFVSTIKHAEDTGIPSLGVTQDHRTGKLYILNAAIPTTRGGIELISEISASQLLDGQYQVKDVYKNGIPELGEEKIPPEFRPFLRRQASYMEALRAANPNFEETQAIQDPDTVLLTSIVRPSRGRLPEISGKSTNRIFALTVARDPRSELGDVDFQSMQDASDQLQYPLVNALHNNGNPSLPFSSLNGNGTVILETRSMDLSLQIAEGLCDKPWFQQWAERPGNKIMVAETTKGIVRNAEYFTRSQWSS